MTALLERGLEDKKLTVELRARLAHDYATNPEGLRALLAAMPAYRAITAQLAMHQGTETDAQWTWDDYEKNDPAGSKLQNLRATDPVRYKALFDQKFGS